MGFYDLLVLTLASGCVVDVWLNGSIFAGRRAAVQAADEAAAAEGRRCLWAELLKCSFCMTVWAPAVLLLAFYAPGGLWRPLDALRPALTALAAARAAWLVNGLVPKGLAYDRVAPLPPRKEAALAVEE